MGVAAENDVDAGDAAGKLEVDVHAVVGEQQHGVDLFPAAQVVDHLLELGVTDPERPIRHEALGMRDRHIGHGLADDRDPMFADLPDDGRFEHAA